MEKYDLLKPTELDFLTFMRQYDQDEHSGNKAFCSNKQFLEEWNDKKEMLFHLLGDQLTVCQKVDFRKKITELKDDMRNLVQKHYDFIQAVENAVSPDPMSQERLYVDLLFTPQFLAENAWMVPGNYNFKKDNRRIALSAGMKIMKILNKITQLYNIDKKLYQDFCNEHSVILQNAYTKGELYLSIHPLDYLTMSVNSLDWTSCMDWFDHGCYRRGVLSMLNSPYIVVAYLKSSEDYSYNSYTWNNKKWRCLYFVNENLICEIKQYPNRTDNRNRDLAVQVTKTLKELAQKNLGWQFGEVHGMTSKCNDFPINNGKNHLTIRLDTAHDIMYNDMNSCPHVACVNQKYDQSQKDEYLRENYDGLATCAWCGYTTAYVQDNFPDDGESVYCNDCSNVGPFEYCSCCGEPINSEDDVYYSPNGDPYCEDCYEENFIYSELYGEDIDFDSSYSMTLLPISTLNEIQTEYGISDKLMGHFINNYFIGKHYLRNSYVPCDDINERTLVESTDYCPGEYINCLEDNILNIDMCASWTQNWCDYGTKEEMIEFLLSMEE